jgi:hypothetical protein
MPPDRTMHFAASTTCFRTMPALPNLGMIINYLPTTFDSSPKSSVADVTREPSLVCRISFKACDKGDTYHSKPLSIPE